MSDRMVLVTGASGFIGRAACDALVERGWEVHALTSRGEINGVQVVNEKCDLFDSTAVREMLYRLKPSHLLHLAWYAEHGKFWHSLENLKWVRASLGLFADFRQAGGERVVAAGTCAEYDWRYGLLSEHLTPAEPETIYGECKNSLQRMLGHLSKETGLSSAWGRIFFLYGPNEVRTRLIPSVIISMLQGKPARCTLGNQIRDFLHVKDVGRAFAGLLESDVQGPVNIGSGMPITLKTMVEKIGAIIGRPDLVELGALPAPANDPMMIVACTQRLFKEMGFSPSIKLDEGLASVIDWWKNCLDK